MRGFAVRRRRGQGVGALVPGLGEGRRVAERQKPRWRRRRGRRRARAAAPIRRKQAPPRRQPTPPLHPDPPVRRRAPRVRLRGRRRGPRRRLRRADRRRPLRDGGGLDALVPQGRLESLPGGDGDGGGAQPALPSCLRRAAVRRRRAAVGAGVGAPAAAAGAGGGGRRAARGRVPGAAPRRGAPGAARARAERQRSGDEGGVRASSSRHLRGDRDVDVRAVAGGGHLRRGARVEGQRYVFFSFSLSLSLFTQTPAVFPLLLSPSTS